MRFKQRIVYKGMVGELYTEQWLTGQIMLMTNQFDCVYRLRSDCGGYLAIRGNVGRLIIFGSGFPIMSDELVKVEPSLYLE